MQIETLRPHPTNYDGIEPQIVTLADVYADLAEDVVRGCRMEADLRHFEVIQIGPNLAKAEISSR